MISCQTPRPRAFSLPELLVVLGVAVVLIAVALPALSTARRYSRQTACAASLHAIGQAFNVYANQYSGYWPPVQDDYAVSGQQDQKLYLYATRRWFDYLSSAIGTSMNVDGRYFSEILSSRHRASIFLGCPERQPSASAFSYGMNAYPLGRALGTLNSPSPNLIRRARDIDYASHRPYYKASIWHRASARPLVADCRDYLLRVSTVPWWGLGEPVPDAPHESFCNLDFIRHRSSRERGIGGDTINVLYADGHVASASAKMATDAIMSRSH